MIDHYSFGSIKIDGKNYEHDMIISSSGVKSWWRATSHEVSINDVEPILEEKPKTIIFGTGASGVMKVSSETEDYLRQQGISIEILKTPEAVELFNTQSTTTGVVAALHLTC